MDRIKDFLIYLYNNYNYKPDLSITRVKAILLLVDKELISLRGYSLSLLSWYLDKGVLKTKEYDVNKVIEEVGIEKKESNFGCLITYLKPNNKNKEFNLSKIETDTINQYIEATEVLSFNGLMNLVSLEI